MRLEYLTPEPRDAEREEEEAPFAGDMTYAWFAARLGWTPDEYGSLTPVQRALVRKELERITVERSTVMELAVETAVANVLRKKGRKRLKLWRKRFGEVSEPPVGRAEFDALRDAFAAKAKG